MSLESFFSRIAHEIVDIPQDVYAFLTSAKFKAVEDRIAKYTTEAYPVVKKIAEMTGNKTVEEVATAYEKFGLPVVGAITTESVGNQLLNLATAILKRTFSGAATSEIQTAIQAALTMFSAFQAK